MATAVRRSPPRARPARRDRPPRPRPVDQQLHELHGRHRQHCRTSSTAPVRRRRDGGRRRRPRRPRLRRPAVSTTTGHHPAGPTDLPPTTTPPRHLPRRPPTTPPAAPPCTRPAHRLSNTGGASPTGSPALLRLEPRRAADGPHAALNTQAQAHAKYLAGQGTTGSTRTSSPQPDRSGSTPACGDRVKAGCPSCMGWTENTRPQTPTPPVTSSGTSWWTSAPHRANIDKRRRRRVRGGPRPASGGSCYAVHEFGHY